MTNFASAAKLRRVDEVEVRTQGLHGRVRAGADARRDGRAGPPVLGRLLHVVVESGSVGQEDAAELGENDPALWLVGTRQGRCDLERVG